MATADNGGWDFVKEGKTYQYKQGDLVGRIKVLEDNSTDTTYIFKVVVEKATKKPIEVEFPINHKKDLNDAWVENNQADMMQIYPKSELKVTYAWENKK
jgi:hypothetical protein